MGDRVIVVGGGTFGLSSAVELRGRGHEVTLLDPGPLPHPDAASTDISKVLRMDYGSDEHYMRMMEDAFALWRAWNDELGEIVFHETGVLFLAKGPLEPGGYEHDGLQLLLKRGHTAERVSADEIARRFPAWNSEIYTDGYYNPQGGWSPSGRVMALLAERARQMEVNIVEGASFVEFVQSGSRVEGVKSKKGDTYKGDWVLVAAGSWAAGIVPWLEDVMWPVAQPVFHFRPSDLETFQPPLFPVWTADVGRTGWYGFPAKQDGTLKVANHGPGWKLDPSGPRQMPEGTETRFREFFAESLPDLVKAPRIGERLCFYSDTFDTDFWIDHDPERPGLVVSSGGSGHAFKFTPLLGVITADVLEGKDNPYAPRFAWRARGDMEHEGARHIET